MGRGADPAKLGTVAAMKPLGNPSSLGHVVQVTFAECTETLQHDVHKTHVDF